MSSLTIPAEGTSRDNAESVFRQVLEDHPMAGKRVRGWGGALLKDFCEPTGWLGLWMLRAEINATVLLGSRLWDVAYQASEQAAQGVLPIDRSMADLPAEIDDSFEQSPVGSREDLTAALRYILAYQGLSQSIEIVGNEIVPVPVTMYQGELQPGDYLPFPAEPMCVEMLLANFSRRVDRDMAIARERARGAAPSNDSVSPG